MPILRGDAEISSSLRVTVSLFSGMSNGQLMVGCNNLKMAAIGRNV